MVLTPNDILRECSLALEMLSESNDGIDFRAHVLALLYMRRLHVLPPHQQSLNLLAANLQNALRAAERSSPLLQGLSTDLSFDRDPHGRRIEPSVLRTLLSSFHGLALVDRDVAAVATERFVLQHAQADESTFLSSLLCALMPMHPGATVLDSGDQSGLRIAMAQRLSAAQQGIPGGLARFHVRAETDNRQSQRLVGLVASLCDVLVDFQDMGRAFEAYQPLRVYDRLFVERRDQAPSFAAIVRCMAEHSQAALLFPDDVVRQIRKSEMAVLLDRDVLDTVISIHGHVRPSWHLMLLRGKKGVERRHRVLFYDYVDNADGPELEAQAIEDIVAAYETFQPGDHHGRVLHRSDIVASASILPASHGRSSLFAYQRDSYPGALSTGQFIELDARMIARGLDVHSFFQKSKKLDCYRPGFRDPSLVRVAVSSAPTLKNAEIRTHYAFATWWQRWSPLLLLKQEAQAALRESFVDAVCKDSVLPLPRAKALFRSWWDGMEDERMLLRRNSPLTVATGWIDRTLGDAERKGRRFWFELDTPTRRMLEYMCPNTMRSLQQSQATLRDIVQTQNEVQIGSSKSIADRLLERRRITVDSDIHHARVQAEVVRERIGELKSFVGMQKDRIAELHRDAKEKRTDERTVTLHDDTRDMQDELGLIFARLVPAQSELSMLEKSLQPFMHLEERRQAEQLALNEVADRLIPELRELRSALSPQLSGSLVLLQFREQLSRFVEEAMLRNREDLIRELEQLWRRFEQGAPFSPEYQQRSTVRDLN